MVIIQKRLHISGLTPAILENDIRARLEKFVDVKTIDGFGKLNALGEPRRFAYATVEATEQNLARCFNTLSGALWKGAKLRIGEAKPDYIQRLKKESETQEIERPKKRSKLLRGVQGVHAKDLSPVTLANVDSRPGWHKTTLLHLIRPMKMRPSRPLPALPSKLAPKPRVNSQRKKALHALTRARIQKIDTRLWNPVHVTGKMLQSVVIAPSVPVLPRTDIPTAASSLTTDDIPSSGRESSPSTVDEPAITITKATRTKSIVPSIDRAKAPQDDMLVDNISVNDVDWNIQQENAQHLKLLSSMFGESSDAQGDHEDPDEDTDSVKSAEDVSLSHDVTEVREKEIVDPDEDIVMEDALDHEPSEMDENKQSNPSPTLDDPYKVQKPKEKSLKDLFKHQEDTTFSLMAGLDLDLDLELELDPAFGFPKPAESQFQSHTSTAQTESTIRPSTSVYYYEGLKLDPTLPLFFPQPGDPRSKDLITTAKSQGWQFCRTDDSEAIRKRWDEVKGGLTHDWKKRSREAVKARKRRFGAEAMEEL